MQNQVAGLTCQQWLNMQLLLAIVSHGIALLSCAGNKNGTPAKLKEALYINMKDPAMNKDKGLELSYAWIEVVTRVSAKPKS